MYGTLAGGARGRRRGRSRRSRSPRRRRSPSPRRRSRSRRRLSGGARGRPRLSPRSREQRANAAAVRRVRASPDLTYAVCGRNFKGPVRPSVQKLRYRLGWSPRPQRVYKTSERSRKMAAVRRLVRNKKMTAAAARAVVGSIPSPKRRVRKASGPKISPSKLPCVVRRSKKGTRCGKGKLGARPSAACVQGRKSCSFTADALRQRGKHRSKKAQAARRAAKNAKMNALIAAADRLGTSPRRLAAMDAMLNM